jgi:hypothetical protein
MVVNAKRILLSVTAVLYAGVLVLIVTVFRMPKQVHQFATGDTAKIVRDFQATEPSMVRFNAQTGMPEIVSMGATCAIKADRRITLASKRPDGQFVVYPNSSWLRLEEEGECRSTWMVVVPTSVMRWIDLH